jgi:hypothetical protein
VTPAGRHRDRPCGGRLSGLWGNRVGGGPDPDLSAFADRDNGEEVDVILQMKAL